MTSWGRGLPVVVDVLVGVVHAEGLVDGGALVHELDGAAGVGRDVADGEQPADTPTTHSDWEHWEQTGPAFI